MAIEQQLPLLPVTVTGTREIVPNKTLAVFPGIAKLTIHEPIDTTGMTAAQTDELISEARRRIESALPAKGS